VIPHVGAIQRRDQIVHSGRGDSDIRTARPLDERRRATVAQAKARRGHDISSIPQVGQEVIAAGLAASNIVANVDDDGRSLLRRDQGVKRGDPECLGGRHYETAADLVEPPGADPSDPRLQRGESRKKQVAKAARFVTTADDPTRHLDRLAGGNGPFDDFAFSGCGLGGHESKIHSDPDPLTHHVLGG
jgi:hypothetical protein